MKMRPLHWFASIFLLLVFLGSKSIEYHSATHMDDGSTECEWCDFALLLHTTPFEPVSEASPEFVQTHFESGQANYIYTFVFVSRQSDFPNFSRPPPYLS